jgi:LuxR family transcriptional regulator
LALEWVADGKTMRDVALLMGFSATMVAIRLRLASEGLSVDTKVQATLAA